MKFIGIIFIAAGMGLAIAALEMNTSVRVDYPDGNSYGLPERVSNLDLMSKKQSYLIYSGILVFLGAVGLMLTKSKSEAKGEVNNSAIGKMHPPVKILSNEKKYENLEKIGNLFEKGLLSKEEFEAEKKKILSEDLSNAEVLSEVEPDFNSNIEDIISNIKQLIDKDKNNFLMSYVNEIKQNLNDSCTTKAICITLIEGYNSNYNSDLINDLKNLSTNYRVIKEILNVFIQFDIVEENYPHELK